MTSTSLNRDSKEIKKAYQERNLLVCFVSRLFPSYIVRHKPTSRFSRKGWPFYVLIQTPEGQLSWHIPEKDLGQFAHCLVLDEDVVEYDGHDTDTKNKRLQKLTRSHLINWQPGTENPHTSH